MVPSLYIPTLVHGHRILRLYHDDDHPADYCAGVGVVVVAVVEEVEEEGKIAGTGHVVGAVVEV